MEVPRPDGPDVDRGTSVFIGCWVLTAFVGCVLLFRYSVKAWMYWMLPKVSTPERIWGFDDLFYLLGYAFDVGHMSMIWKRHAHPPFGGILLTNQSGQWGLGRHFFYLSPLEKHNALMWDFVSQPLAVSAAMWSRTGVIIFLYSCLAQNTRSIKWVIIICGIVQIVVNLFTILQIFLQCGPNPYRLANRAAYFHYMWDPLPADNSVVCQPPTVQALVGYIQGGFNCIIDFTLTFLAAFEVWQIVFRTNNGTNGRQMSWTEQFKRLDSHVRNQRLWQTLLLCGPLLLSGVASIVKTYLLSALGSRLDFTWNIVPFVLWVKIEDASIPISTCGPVLRLFARIFTEKKRNNSNYGSGSGYGPRSRRSVQPAEPIGVSNRSGDRNSQALKRLSSKVGTFTVAGGVLTESEIDLTQYSSWSGKSQIMVKTEYDVHTENKSVKSDKSEYA